MQFATFALAALSIGSVFAAPPTVVRRDAVLDAAISAVNTAQTAVASEVVIINNAVQGTLNLPVIQGSLTNIANAISSATSAVTPLVTDVALPLTNAELSQLSGLVTSVEDIANNVKTAANDVINNVTGLSGILVRAEAVVVINTIGPFVTPVTQFANSAIAGVTDPIVSTIQSTLTTITSTVSSLLGPILTAILGL
ncbi:hypothetical protein F4680DRAFT_467320 [Xylaria scruposa]|nr:hypothetical protein F4680DRAFT_467320 [Xylaria scruposa]